MSNHCEIFLTWLPVNFVYDNRAVIFPFQNLSFNTGATVLITNWLITRIIIGHLIDIGNIIFYSVSTSVIQIKLAMI